MNKNIKTELKLIYKNLNSLVKESVPISDWSEYDAFFTELVELYTENSTQLQYNWFTTFYQIYCWQFISSHEGVLTYYSNFYGESDYLTLIKTAEYLQGNGFDDIYNIFVQAIHDYTSYDLHNYPKDWIEEAKIIYYWINNNIEQIYKCMLDILLNNIQHI